MTGIAIVFISMTLFLNLILSKVKEKLIFSIINFMMFIFFYLFYFIEYQEIAKLVPILMSCVILVCCYLILGEKKEMGKE